MALPLRSRALIRTSRALRKLRSLLLLGMLSLALMIVELFTGCDTTEEEPSVYYGPPTADATDATEGVDAVSDVPVQSDTGPVVYYGPQPVDALGDVPPQSDTSPVVYYGPQPVDALDDVPQQSDTGPVVYYGPQPVDALDDVPQQSDTGPVVYYGPQPVDALDDVPQSSDGGLVVFYGPQPVDAATPADLEDKDCPPIAFYGPPPCTSDEDCVAWYGAGWYCDKDNTFSDGCGGIINFPMCEPLP